MNLVYGYAAIAALSGIAAYMTGQGGGGQFWLYVAGAALFALAAVGQYFKTRK